MTLQAQPPSSLFSQTEHVRSVIAQVLLVGAEELQEIAGPIVVTTSDKVPEEQRWHPDAVAVFDKKSKTLTLMADLFHDGQEALTLAAEMVRYHGEGVARQVLQEEVIDQYFHKPEIDPAHKQQMDELKAMTDTLNAGLGPYVPTKESDGFDNDSPGM